MAHHTQAHKQSETSVQQHSRNGHTKGARAAKTTKHTQADLQGYVSLHIIDADAFYTYQERDREREKHTHAHPHTIYWLTGG